MFRVHSARPTHNCAMRRTVCQQAIGHLPEAINSICYFNLLPITSRSSRPVVSIRPIVFILPLFRLRPRAIANKKTSHAGAFTPVSGGLVTSIHWLSFSVIDRPPASCWTTRWHRQSVGPPGVIRHQVDISLVVVSSNRSFRGR